MSLRKSASHLLGAIVEAPRTSVGLFMGITLLAVGSYFVNQDRDRRLKEGLEHNNFAYFARQTTYSVAINNEPEGATTLEKMALFRMQSKMLYQKLISEADKETTVSYGPYYTAALLIGDEEVDPNLVKLPPIKQVREVISKSLKPELKSRRLNKLSLKLGQLPDDQFLLLAGILQRNKFTHMKGQKHQLEMMSKDLDLKALEKIGIPEGEISYIKALTLTN